MVYSIDVIENVSGIIWMCFVFVVRCSNNGNSVQDGYRFTQPTLS